MREMKILNQTFFLEINYFGGEELKIEIWNNKFQISTKITPKELQAVQGIFNEAVSLALRAYALEKDVKNG